MNDITIHPHIQLLWIEKMALETKAIFVGYKQVYFCCKVAILIWGTMGLTRFCSQPQVVCQGTAVFGSSACLIFLPRRLIGSRWESEEHTPTVHKTTYWCCDMLSLFLRTWRPIYYLGVQNFPYFILRFGCISGGRAIDMELYSCHSYVAQSHHS